MIKTKVDFVEGRIYQANQSNLKGIQRSLIDWNKAGPLKQPLKF